MLDLILLLMGIVMVAGGCMIIKESIQKRNFDKKFSEAFGMLAFGTIICLAWISNMF